MKSGFFMLTKNEQRVVILVVTALLIGASVRYWRAVNRDITPSQTHAEPTATPLPSPDEESSPDQD